MDPHKRNIFVCFYVLSCCWAGGKGHHQSGGEGGCESKTVRRPPLPFGPKYNDTSGNVQRSMRAAKIEPRSAPSEKFELPPYPLILKKSLVMPLLVAKICKNKCSTKIQSLRVSHRVTSSVSCTIIARVRGKQEAKRHAYL